MDEACLAVVFSGLQGFLLRGSGVGRCEDEREG